MGLKQSIVVVNEYTIKNKSGKGGSRGGTPGNYVLRYMSRDGATEISSPVTLNNEDYVVRYMARSDAVEKSGTEAELKQHMKDAQKMGGVAFSQKSLSLSHTDLIKSAKDIQQAFDKGKTVMKTVISFDEEYLRENGIIRDDFVFTKRGDFRGNIDQIKLRYAISRGMELLSHDYDDLRYVAVIQVDTAHVHCHVAMADMGVGNITEDGTQRGKLTEYNKTRIRRGIDLALDEAKEVQYMASSVGMDKRNVSTNLKRYTYEQVTLYGAPQRILSLLPDDEKLWRAKTNRKEMKAANKLCRSYVEHVLYSQDSGMDEAVSSIRNYADARQRREGIDDDERDRLVADGIERIVEGCMNGVYQTLKQIPDERRSVATPFLDIGSDSEPVPTFKKDAGDMVYRMSAYSSRMSKHRRESKRYDSFMKDYEASDLRGNASDDSRILYDFFTIEREYHMKLASKYSHFLFFERPSEEFTEEYIRLMKRAGQLNGMKQFAKDASAKKMGADAAEEYGRKRYDIYGGRFLILDKSVYDKRFEKLQASYDKDFGDFKDKLAVYNLGLVYDRNGKQVIGRVHAYDFDEVKGLDLHDIRGDFSDSLEFSGKVRNDFMSMAKRRIESYDKACEYLDRTGQGHLKQVFDAPDIEGMRFVMNVLENGQSVPAVKHRIHDVQHKKVMPIDKSMHSYLCSGISKSVHDFKLEQLYQIGE